MAKFVVVCARGRTSLPRARIARACRLLSPDHVTLDAPEYLEGAGLALAIANPTPVIARHGTSACVGQMFGPRDGWYEPGAAVPDGTFALIRSDEERVEIVTDGVGSRSVFYAHTPDLFVASSSQRAIISVLGGFTLSPRALPWILSTGSLGPEATWDDRVTRLGPDARLMLDRRAWTLQRDARPISFLVERLSAQDHAARLREALRTTCDRLDLDGAEWRLPLSGGCDSRALLLHIAPRNRIPCITWGLAEALEDPKNDAAVARQLANAVGVPHEYLPIHSSKDAFEVLFDRFLANGEGCVDHIGAYMDGFEVWRHLRETGVAGIVRGDEGCGWTRVFLESDVRRAVGAEMLTDFFPRRRLEALGLAEQTWPPALARAPDETLAAWRDRLYHSYRIPIMLAALTDLKTSYVEVVNPLLSRQVLDVVRAMPDDLRTGKILFRKVVTAMSPPIPFASRAAIANFDGLVSSKMFRTVARREIEAGRDMGSLPAPLAGMLLANLSHTDRQTTKVKAGDGLSRGRSLLRLVLPRVARSVVHILRPRPPPTALLAFRAAIVSRMARDLTRASGPDQQE
jgi:hypothetical protein